MCDERWFGCNRFGVRDFGGVEAEVERKRTTYTAHCLPTKEVRLLTKHTSTSLQIIVQTNDLRIGSALPNRFGVGNVGGQADEGHFTQSKYTYTRLESIGLMVGM